MTVCYGKPFWLTVLKIGEHLNVYNGCIKQHDWIIKGKFFHRFEIFGLIEKRLI